MSSKRIAIVGGGAAGFFGAIACAEADPEAQITVFEKGPGFLAKVRISGGGRCNVTHACFEPRALSAHYPRGERALIGPFHRFQPADTLAWFESKGVPLKTESDGRIFPVSDSSESIVSCLMREATQAGVSLVARRGVEEIQKNVDGTGFVLRLNDGTDFSCDCLLLAPGGCRTSRTGELAASLGHTLEPPVPSLFTFHIDSPWLRELPGLSVDDVEVSIPGTTLRQRGPLLVTHWGLSGPAVLRLSAWGARELHARNYQFELQLKWRPGLTTEAIAQEIESLRSQHAAKRVANTPISPLPTRLWKELVSQANIAPETRWSQLPRGNARAIVKTLAAMKLQVSGKSLNKDEFVTCGGIRLREVNFKTMESRITPNLFLAGEILDIDGITGGFNFQAAWTTGWLAGKAMAAKAR